jgi:cytochrome c553
MAARIEVLLKRGILIAAALVCATTTATAQSVAERLAPCLACHGEGGTSSTPDVPSPCATRLFRAIQLFMFRERLRPIEPMSSMLKGVSDNDLRAMADAIAKLPPPKADASPVDATRVARAEEAVAQHRCNFCHSGDVPDRRTCTIAGQREEYLRRRRGYNTRRGMTRRCRRNDR